MKFLVVGYDGLPPEMLQNITDISYEHFDIRPMTVEIPISGPSWTTLYTGLSAVQHQCTESLGYATPWGDTYATLKHKCVWDYLGDAGYTVALCNTPCTRGIRKVNGFHVGGFPTIRNDYLYPKDLKVPAGWLKKADLCHDAVYEKEKDSWGPDWGIRMNLLTIDKLLERVYNDSLDVAKWFVEQARSFDFGWIVFTFVDRLGHPYGLTPMITQACSVMILDTMKALVELYPENVLIVSDHGFDQSGEHGGHPYHTKTGVIAGFGDVAGDIDLKDDWENRDVTPLILKHFGVEFLEPEQPSEEELREAEEIVYARLEQLGYIA